MKKISLIALFAALVAVNINATDLFVGSHAVTWATPLDLEAAKFADAKAGDKIVVTYTDAAHGIEFKIPEVWDHMAGSREAAWINGAAAYEQFLTAKAVEQIKANGLQIVGNRFTITKVELLDGRVLKEGGQLSNSTRRATTPWTSARLPHCVSTAKQAVRTLSSISKSRGMKVVKLQTKRL